MYVVIIKERGTDKIIDSVKCHNFEYTQKVKAMACVYFDLNKYYIEVREV